MREGSRLVWCVVWGVVWGVVWVVTWVVTGEVVWVIQASCFLQRFLRQNIQDDDFMFELNGLEILTQKNWIDHRRVFANIVSRPSIIPNGGSEKTQNYATYIFPKY